MNIFSNAMTIEEAVRVSAMLPALPYEPDPAYGKGLRPGKLEPILPTKVFDNVFWVGSQAVGATLIDTGDGLILIDQGSSEEEAVYMEKSIRDLGFDPSEIKLLMISHEHFDHYGGTPYFKKHVCPDANVAMSRVGWNILQTATTEFAFGGERPEKADILLTDGMCIRLGNTCVFTVYTPGHSMGCMSFIFNTSYKGKPINAAMMGGSVAWQNMPEARTYQNSVEYFKLFTDIAGCTAYTAAHVPDEVIRTIDDSWKGKCENPWVADENSFEEVFFKPFRDRVQAILEDPDTFGYRVPAGTPAAKLMEE